MYFEETDCCMKVCSGEKAAIPGTEMNAFPCVLPRLIKQFLVPSDFSQNSGFLVQSCKRTRKRLSLFASQNCYAALNPLVSHRETNNLISMASNT